MLTAFVKERKKRPLSERFWEKVRKGDICWEWIASKNKTTGYGQFSKDGKPRVAHRVAYELVNGKIPSWPIRVVMHTCDNKACVNPAHLQLATQGENLKDSVNKGRFKRVSPTLMLRGELHPNAKLSQKDVNNIRALFWDTGNISARSISKQYRLSPTYAYDIIHFKKWCPISS